MRRQTLSYQIEKLIFSLLLIHLLFRFCKLPSRRQTPHKQPMSLEPEYKDYLTPLIKLFEKQSSVSSVKVSDLIQILIKLHTQEQNIQRSLRALVRENQELRNSYTSLCARNNSALAQVSQHAVHAPTQQQLMNNVMEEQSSRIDTPYQSSNDEDDTNVPITSRQQDTDINVLTNDHGLHLVAFNGDGSVPFSDWLLKFEDYAEGHIPPWTKETKARKSFTEEEKSNIDRAVGKLRSIYESPAQRDIARQRLYHTYQHEAESVHEVAERLQQLVTAATSGSNAFTFNDTLRDHFLDRLHPKIRYHVKREHPSTFEEAFESALENECLLKDQKLAERNTGNQLGISDSTLRKSAPPQDTAHIEMLHLLRGIRDKLTVAENSRSAADNIDIVNAIRSGFEAFRPHPRGAQPNARSYHAQDNRYNVTRRDREVANSTRAEP